jgi:hypothetical protein
VGPEQQLSGGQFGGELRELGAQKRPVEGDASRFIRSSELLVESRPFRLVSMALRRSHFQYPLVASMHESTWYASRHRVD